MGLFNVGQFVLSMEGEARIDPSVYLAFYHRDRETHLEKHRTTQASPKTLFCLLSYDGLSSNPTEKKIGSVSITM